MLPEALPVAFLEHTAVGEKRMFDFVSGYYIQEGHNRIILPVLCQNVFNEEFVLSMKNRKLTSWQKSAS